MEYLEERVAPSAGGYQVFVIDGYGVSPNRRTRMAILATYSSDHGTNAAEDIGRVS